VTKTDLRLKVAELERELEYRKKESDLAIEKSSTQWRVQLVEEGEKTRTELAKSKVIAEQYEARLKDAPYAQLTELLKAIVVKLPTLNVNELSVKTKEK